MKTEFFPKNKVWLYAVNIKIKNEILPFGLYTAFSKRHSNYTNSIHSNYKSWVEMYSDYFGFVHNFM